MRQERRFGSLNNNPGGAGLYLPLCDPVPTGHRYNCNLLLTNRTAGAITTRLLAATPSWPALLAPVSVVGDGTNTTWAEASPDGMWCAAVQSTHLYVRPLLRNGFGANLIANTPLPTIFDRPVRWSPSGKAFLAPLTASPWIAAYSFDPISGTINGRFADPGVLPQGRITDLAFSDDGKYLAFSMTNTASPWIGVYPWDDLTGFGTRFADPATPPTYHSGANSSVCWSHDGLALFYANSDGSGYARLEAYAMSSSAFVSKYANASLLGSVMASIAPNQIAVHPSGAYVYMLANADGQRFPWSNSSGFGAASYMGFGGIIVRHARWVPRPASRLPTLGVWNSSTSPFPITLTEVNADGTLGSSYASAAGSNQMNGWCPVDATRFLDASSTTTTMRTFAAEPTGADLAATFAYDTSIASKAQLKVSGFVLEAGERLVVQNSAVGIDYALSGVDIS